MVEVQMVSKRKEEEKTKMKTQIRGH